jgi:hypothetical protein
MQPPIAADAMEAGRKDVLKEAANESVWPLANRVAISSASRLASSRSAKLRRTRLPSTARYTKVNRW